MQRQVIDVTRLVDEQVLGQLTFRVIGLTFLVMLSDGYDLAAAAYAAPGVIHGMGVNREAFGVVFGASLFGMLFGSPIFGFLGDRFGRKRPIACAGIFYGIFSLLCATATSLPELTIFRFFVGVGLGGLLPNVTALNAEFAPKRLRATFTILTFLGLTAGGTIPALTGAMLSQDMWRTLFVLGGVFPIVVAPFLLFLLPESIKFMALRGGREAEIAKLAAQLQPALKITPDAVFVVKEPRRRGLLVAALFEGPLKIVTPLLWVGFAANLMVNFFLNNWMPILLHDAGLSPSQASLTASMYYFGGIAGGLLIGRVLDTIGIFGLVVLFTLACPITASIGTPGLPQWGLMVLVFLAGFSVLGTQLGLSASAGAIYPTAIRSNGAGWAHAIGRVGAIAGPMVGAWLLGMHLPLRYLLLVPALPLAIGAVATLIMTRIYSGPIGEHQGSDGLVRVSEP